MSKITTSLFQEMVQAASTRLNKQAEYVNSLNVFPVPDGDTGTNMGMTIENGAKEVADKPASTVGEVASILAKGLLMGARGNSGVITSQLFRGFSQAIKDKDELTGQDLALAFQSGVEVAYKAVMKPVEGTILTVSRGAAIGAKKKAEQTESQELEDLGLKVEPSFDIEQVATEVTTYVQTIIDDMDVESTISNDYNRRSINLQIDTNEPGRIIGYHGKVLKALQLLAQNYLYNRYSRTFYITINVNDYVEHRAEVLQTYAQKLATRVLEEGRSHQTDPMSNSERKIIHRIISRMDGVTSYSEGDEPNRYVVVDTE